MRHLCRGLPCRVPLSRLLLRPDRSRDRTLGWRSSCEKAAYRDFLGCRRCGARLAPVAPAPQTAVGGTGEKYSPKGSYPQKYGDGRDRAFRSPTFPDMFRRTVRDRLSELGRERPGHRFGRFHARRHRWRQQHPVASRVVAVIGALLVVLGAALSIPPGVPGFIVSLIGLALLVSGSRKLARWLDRGEILARHLRNRMGRRFRGRPWGE